MPPNIGKIFPIHILAKLGKTFSFITGVFWTHSYHRVFFTKCEVAASQYREYRYRVIRLDTRQ